MSRPLHSGLAGQKALMPMCLWTVIKMTWIVDFYYIQCHRHLFWLNYDNSLYFMYFSGFFRAMGNPSESVIFTLG
jgi:hypothetical protein